MKIDFIRKNDILIVKLNGELDHHYAENVRKLIENAVKKCFVSRLLFDCKDLTFMDSSGIGVIIGRYKTMKSLGGDVAIYNCNTSVNKLIEVSGIKKIIKIYENETEALGNEQ